jgi:beta-galactosidase/beta-glucuronidase
MRTKIAIAIVGLVFVTAATARAQSPEQDPLFNDGWKFHLGDLSAAEAPKFDDSAWRPVQLPHDWSIEGSFDQKWASCEAYLPTGIGWYRKTFSLPAFAKSKLVGIRFDGIYENSQVWINGHLLGTQPNGFITFQYDLTPYLEWDNPNILAVRVDHSSIADARWYTGSGINRNVRLTVTNRVHVDPGDVFVTTPDGKAIQVQYTVKNESDSESKLQVTSYLRNAAGQDMVLLGKAATVPAHGSQQVEQRIPVPDPHNWSPDDPYLYSLEIQVSDDSSMLDTYSLPVGIRTFHFDPSKGFSLNGQSMKLKGVCLHENAGALGSAIPIEVWERRLPLLKRCGCNAIRTSHNPPAPEFLDLCDRMGFLVMDEAFDEWVGGKKKWTNGHNAGKYLKDGYWEYFDKWSQIDLADMIRRDRNHPSIILWSIGNEIDYPNDPFPKNSPALAPVATKLIKIVKDLDQTRPVTAACAAIASNLYFPQLDVVGYNYQETRYTDDHAKFPSRIMIGSENSQMRPAWFAVANNDFIAGQFLWTGIDYLGEAPRWPIRNGDTGLLDLAGFPKPIYYARQSLWSDAPMVYLNPTARFVLAYTNCDSVELWHDGKLIATRNCPPTRVIPFTYTFTSGVLKAVGKVSRDGKPADACSFELQHSEQAESLNTVWVTKTPVRIAQVEIDCVDQNGNRDPNAANEISLTMSGPMRLLGIENGDPASHESYQAPTHHAFHGRMLIYLKSTGSGDGQLTVSSPGLQDDHCTILLK